MLKLSDGARREWRQGGKGGAVPHGGGPDDAPLALFGRAAVVVGGRSGTLGEFAIAYEHGKLLEVLSGSGGITDALPALEVSLSKKTGAEVLCESDPRTLVTQVLEPYRSPDYECPCYPRRT